MLGRFITIMPDNNFARSSGQVGKGKIEFEWTIFTRIFVMISLSRDPERLGDEEHQAKDRIIFMSMFNDIMHEDF